MQKVEVKLIDDLDGSDAVESVTFGIDNLTYEIDLSSANAAKLRRELDQFVTHARVVKRGRPTFTRPTVTKPKVDKEQLDAIRRWGKDHGFDVSDRGRIPVSVQEAYHAAEADELPVVVKPAPAKPKRPSRAKVETPAE